MSDLIVLKDRTPIASGKTQIIYQHPADPALLVKVRKLGKLQRDYDRKIGGMIGYRRPHGLYTTWMRELEHYFSICLRLGYHPQFLQHYHGVFDTDAGLGLVVSKVTGRSGAPARTLKDVVLSDGLTVELRQKLDELLGQLNESRVSTNDISPSNIVYGWTETAGDHLVLIEGIGVNTFIPLARFSNYLNVRSNNRHFARTVRWLEGFDRARAKAVSAS